MYNMHCNNCIQEDEGEDDTSSDDMSSDGEAYSAIEERRLASIRRNALAWDEIGKVNLPKILTGNATWCVCVCVHVLVQYRSQAA